MARKTHYSDYVKHMLRFYVKYRDIDRIYKGVTKQNMDAVKKVMDRIGEKEKKLICAIFDPGYDVKVSLKEIICVVSRKYGVSEYDLWRIVSDTQKAIAEERGLI